MKFIQLAVLVPVLALGACAGDSSRKNTDAASRQTQVPSSVRCPTGYAEDFAGHCVEQQGQTVRRAPARDTLGRPIERPLPDFSLPTRGILGR